MSKLGYLGRSILGFLDPARRACPNCGAASSHVVARKYVLTSLQRCSECLLLFRAPTDPPIRNHEFYQSDYSQGFTTSLPSPDELAALTSTDFRSIGKDYSTYIAAVRRAGFDRCRLFEYGCSWGYGSYQFAKAGYEVRSYEISEPRAVFAKERLGVRTVDFTSWVEQNPGSADVFFSAHVLEHVPSPAAIFESARRLLRPGGLFIAFFPNGSQAHRSADPRAWRMLWGDVHPNFLDEAFLDRLLEDYPRAMGSSSASLGPIGKGLGRLDDLSGSELFVAALIEGGGGRTPGDKGGSAAGHR